MKKILAIETSCDDTAVAVINEQGQILGNAIYTQVHEYARYGGVVPEIGSRAHIEQILCTTKLALKKACLEISAIDVVAATIAPGLVGPLLVGANFAKGLALSLNIPFVGVHHIRGHVLAGLSEPDFPKPPFIALIASGGHSALYQCDKNYRISLIGETLDDAAGEAFDKIGRALGLGYPAGKKMDELARLGDASRFKLPIAMRKESHFNFSFSGLKTEAIRCIREQNPFNEQSLKDLCASVECAISQALCERTLRAAQEKNIKNIVIGGGVAANTGLRHTIKSQCDTLGISLYLPPKELCTDNAVMIARAALIELKDGRVSSLATDVKATLPVEQADALVQ
ncbi:MAG: tRNA (adenosine(37)-N6)-threonylcarbamoyltransferase complex transferase subunit TsaD [Myxococcales bacterium]|nr:tRNA (adenosine(37)-N6)-threonylcarbamoyltransferase complex transferase subunit TsaD [Myxococcales bacterium]USN50504.1 MAG: tRNA (adenosine(37)-N6)-threonylcarbamoyltransferase complex transferase subunit TsaD [Myxococcales bacterium]